MPWVSERWTAEERAVSGAGAGPQPGAGAVTDAGALSEFLWDRKRTVSANGHAGIGRWSAKDAGSSCTSGTAGDFYR